MYGPASLRASPVSGFHSSGTRHDDYYFEQTLVAVRAGFTLRHTTFNDDRLTGAWLIGIRSRLTIALESSDEAAALKSHDSDRAAPFFPNKFVTSFQHDSIARYGCALGSFLRLLPVGIYSLRGSIAER